MIALRRHSPDDAGVSLVELIVAVAVLSIAVVGLFRVFDHAVRSAGGERDRLLAGIVAQNRGAAIALGLDDLPTQERFGGQIWQVDISDQATEGGFREVTLDVRARASGAGVQLVMYDPAGVP